MNKLKINHEEKTIDCDEIEFCEHCPLYAYITEEDDCYNAYIKLYAEDDSDPATFKSFKVGE